MFERFVACALLYAVLPISAPAIAAEAALECPTRITTRQSLYEPQAGWRESQERPFTSARANDTGYSEHNLDVVDFSVGVPDDRISLAPDAETRQGNGRWTATWTFSGKEPIWFSCRYRETSVILSRQLAPEIRRCLVAYDRNKGITVQSVRCR